MRVFLVAFLLSLPAWRVLRVFLYPPDQQVGLYMQRWYILPRNRVFNIYVHRMIHSDDDRGLHDHPYTWNLSIPLCPYIEVVPRDSSIRKGLRNYHYYDPTVRKYRYRFIPILRRGISPHRIIVIDKPVVTPSGVFSVPQTTWSIFITGPTVRTWGFYLPAGWTSHHNVAREDRRNDNSKAQ